MTAAIAEIIVRLLALTANKGGCFYLARPERLIQIALRRSSLQRVPSASKTLALF
jgi:hypothetical protein